MFPHESLDLLYKLLLALILGAIIGIEREKSHMQHKGTDFAGIRTFIIITLFGALAAYLSELYYSWFLAVITISFTVVVVAAYVLSSVLNKDIGMTTSMSAVMAFIIGILSFKTTQEIPILVTIVMTLILSLKAHIHEFVYNLKSGEFFDTIKFLLIAFVILPLLQPIDSFGPYDAINLYEIWLMVVFVSGISYVGYILIKLFGSNSGALMTGILGGIFSSTAVVTALANKSKEDSDTNSLVIAATIASATMFIRVLIEVAILNIAMVEKLAFPMVLLAAGGYISGSLMYRKTKISNAKIEFKSPLMLLPALKFGFFYGFIQIISNLLNSILGSKGLLLAAFISGIGDVDAITIFIARNSGIPIALGISAIVLGATVNTAVKIMYAKLFGTKDYWTKLAGVLAPPILIGLFLTLIL